MKGLAPSLVWLAMIVAAGAGAAGPPENGPGAVVLHVSIQKDELVLNSSVNEQSVSFAGSVLVDYVYLVTVRVALSVSTDLGWAASIVPEDMAFVSSVTQYFNATVSVPAGMFNRTAILTVRGNATIPPGVPGDTGSDTALITVLGGPDGGNGTGPPGIPRVKPAPTGVFVPPVPIIMGAATMGAIVFSALMLWYRKVEPSRRTGWKRLRFGK